MSRAPHFDPEKLARSTGGRWTAAPGGPIAGFATDTRELGRGQMFVALKTEKRDGHAFLSAARAAGASAALVAAADPGVDLAQLVVPDPLAAFQAIAAAHRRLFPGPVIAISGSAGKTSTKNLLALLLDPAVTLATEGNLNNHLGVPLTLTRLDPAVHRYAVVEAGISAPGEMAALAAMIDPDMTLITLVAPAHLAELGGIDGVAREKAVLAAMVRPGGVAIFPRSCAEFAAFRGLKVKTEVVSFTAVHDREETRVTLPAGGTFTLRRVSDGMAQNAALALTAALRLGLSPDEIQRRLTQWRPAPLRGELRRENGRLLYLDCYNANPASMGDALAAFCAIAPPEDPRLFVLGCMEELGAEAPRFHRELGRSLPLRPGDFLFITGENAAPVREGALENGGRAAQIAVVEGLGGVKERLAAFRGSVFVKGSRRYQLERIL